MNLPDRAIFICPISRFIFSNPVLAADGYFYEKDLIKQWLAEHSTSPMTNLKISKTLSKCHYFNAQLKSFLEKNPHEQSNQYIIKEAGLKNHLDHLDKIKKWITSKKFSKLSEYVNFDLKILMNKNLLVPILNSKNNKIIQHVIDHILDYSKKDNRGYGLIHYLIQQLCDTDVIKNFIDKQCTNGSTSNIDSGIKPKKHTRIIESATKQNMRPIHLACKHNLPEIVKFLIEQHNVNLECATKDGVRPVHYACKNAENLSLLIDKGVNVECTTKNADRRPIHYACDYQNAACIKLLIDKGVKLDCQNKDGFKPIHLICQNGYMEGFYLLVDKGIDLETCTKDGDSPIYLACQSGFQEIIQYLANKKVNLDCKTDIGNKLIHSVCKSASLETIKCLINNGICLETVNANNWKPIHFICRYRSKEHIKYFLSCDIDLNAQIMYGYDSDDSYDTSDEDEDNRFQERGIKYLILENDNLNSDQKIEMLEIIFKKEMQESILKKTNTMSNKEVANESVTKNVINESDTESVTIETLMDEISNILND